MGSVPDALGMRLGTAMALELVATGRVRSDEDPWPTVEGIALGRQGFLRINGLIPIWRGFQATKPQNIQRKLRYLYIFQESLYSLVELLNLNQSRERLPILLRTLDFIFEFFRKDGAEKQILI